jgi:hypothetical protein
MTKSFIIDQVSWHTSTLGNTETREQIIRRFYSVTKYLQDNHLTARTILVNPGDVTEEFALRSEDLTEEGLALMKAAYDKWLSKVDQTMDPDDLTIMERALKRIREG